MLDTLATSSDKLPVTIITGFLGSGKTTLLNYILQNFDNYKVAVLVNEFGDINIDSQFLIGVEEDMIELTNGCICCTINDNLTEAVYRVLERRDRIDYLIVETTGVADPLPIALTFLGKDLRDLTQLDAILTLVDAETFISEALNSEAANRQLMYGDMILLNKIDLVAEADLNTIETHARAIKQGAKILRCEYGRVPLSLILDVNFSESGSSEQVLSAPQSGASNHLANDGFMSVSFQSDRPLAMKKFQQFLDYRLPDNVFRAKGVLWFAESPKRHLFQLSGKRFTIDDSEWTKTPKNQLVLIGRKLDPLFLQQTLNNCLTRQQV
ncbi:CobW family GTP-binding protein [Allocoleopsis franciscana]|uniref:Putative GTPase, G3E family n=1 Tax=Allocoleopsis franciscana PCC 7113 TaxID=1173027 RepID=K9WGY7_9CYAN|nr:GTP-binding protein [Allocoleopsis franciscana]AFZ18792.1 putative GTPase, G3E family [Allocoleopsis franciscana PCC 7113]